MGYIFCSHLVCFLKKVYETKLHFLIFFSRNMYCVISKKEKKLYFALESTPASHLFPIKASSKRLGMKKRGGAGGEWGERERGERGERRDSVCACVDVCACLCGCMCVFMCVYVCIYVCVCLGAPRRGTRLELGFN